MALSSSALALGVPAQAAAARATTASLSAVHPIAGHPVGLRAVIRPIPSGGAVAFRTGSTLISGCSAVPVNTSTGVAPCRATFRSPGRRAVSVAYSGRSGAFSASKATSTVTVAPAVTGGGGSCTTSRGALVGVSFGHWGGPVVRGCDTSLTSGRDLLVSAGFSITNVQRFPGFICRLAHSSFRSATPYPTPAQDGCVNTPPASAYWAFWTAAKGASTWTYATKGAGSTTPTDGSVQAWTFGSGDIDAVTNKPAFTPNQVRAGLPARAAALTRQAAVDPGATPDRAAAAAYLVAQLSDGDHVEQFGQPDLGLTIDVALSLASSDLQDPALRAITAYVAAHQNDYTGLSGPLAQYASGGAVGKVALLAETAGSNPRAFGGVDLVAGLDRLVCTGVDVTTGCTAKGGYANTPSVLGQALGVLGQLRAGDRAGAAAPLAYLRGAQAGSGGFPSQLPATGAEPSEVDSTAVAAMALALRASTSARASVTKALSWIAAQQASDGGFPGASGNSVNSAALAVQALSLDTRRYATRIAKAEAFLAGAQNGDGGFDIASGVEGSDPRASAQALGGVVGTPFGSVLDHLPANATAADGADYLVSQLASGDRLTSSYTDANGQTVTYDDQGLTADGVFALIAAGGHAADVARMVRYLSGQVDNYADPSNAFGGPFSGSLAKLALVAESTGGDPHAFGGTNLLTVLRGNVCTAATDPNDFKCTAKGDFVSSFATVSQALGVLALQASRVAADHLSKYHPAVARLLSLQCPDGGFSSALITQAVDCSPDVDTTGYAIQALAAVGGLDAQLGKAQHYLEDAQRGDGLFAGAAGANSNSTALAAQGLQTLVTALHSDTLPAPGPKTRAPIVALQNALTGLDRLATPGGGFGTVSPTPADVRASTQAVAAAAERTLLELSDATIRSAPRDAAVPVMPIGTTSSTPTSAPTSAPTTAPATSTTVAAGPNGSARPIGVADTGATSDTPLLWGVLLLIAGTGLACAGRRRIVPLVGRHRVRQH